MEKFTGEKYPTCLKKWLIHAGYNKLVALAELNDEKISKVEEHIQNHRTTLISGLKCCYSESYKNQATFSFLPGHKATLLGIVSQIAKMKPSASLKVPMKSKLKKKKVRSAAEMKSWLVDKLKAYPAKCGVTLPAGVISEKNVIKFEAVSEGIIENDEQSGVQSYKCLFSCPLCSKKIPVTYKNYWESSNATNHIKVHLEEIKEQASNETLEEVEVAVY